MCVGARHDGLQDTAGHQDHRPRESAAALAVQTGQHRRGQATVTPWRQFFTDPALMALIDTALANNQDLSITLQQIAMAKSNVLYQEGQLLPTVTAGGSVGVSKAGRYTSEGAGNATTEIKPGKDMPDPLMDYQLGDRRLGSGPVAQAEFRQTGGGGALSGYRRGTQRRAVVAHLAGGCQLLSSARPRQQTGPDTPVHRLQKKAVEIAKIQKSADADTELAVEKFEAELAKARSEEYTLGQEMAESENNLNLLLGRYPTDHTPRQGHFPVHQPAKVMTGVPSELLNNRPDIRQAEHELAAAKWNV
jgi:multidrug efflux system outer membrane protein